MKVRSRIGILSAAVLSILIVGSASAWACPGAEISSPDANDPDGNNYLQPGSQIMVHGDLFNKEEGVEIRWNLPNTNSPDAPVLAEAYGTTWDVAVTIPDAEPGTYWLVSVGTDDVRTFSDAITIIIPGATAEEPPAEEPPAEEPAQEEPAQEEPKNEGSTDGQPQNQDSRNADEKDSRGVVTQQGGGTAAAAITESDLRVSTATEITTERASRRGAERGTSAVAASSQVPFRALASASDSGYEFQTQTLESKASRRFEHVPLSNEAPSQLAIGVGVLSIGMVLMFGGLLVAEVRRSRKLEVDAASEPTDLSV